MAIYTGNFTGNHPDFGSQSPYYTNDCLRRNSGEPPGEVNLTWLRRVYCTWHKLLFNEISEIDIYTFRFLKPIISIKNECAGFFKIIIIYKAFETYVSLVSILIYVFIKAEY